MSRAPTRLTSEKVIFFGANDACLPGAAGSQHVPLEAFKNNLLRMVKHTSLGPHKPHIILITPPPINEYLCEENDRLKGYNDNRRKANHTALYAEAVREVAKLSSSYDVALVDLYAAFMKHVGQPEDREVLEGSKERPPNTALEMLLHDGKSGVIPRSST